MILSLFVFIRVDFTSNNFDATHININELFQQKIFLYFLGFVLPNKENFFKSKSFNKSRVERNKKSFNKLLKDLLKAFTTFNNIFCTLFF